MLKASNEDIPAAEGKQRQSLILWSGAGSKAASSPTPFLWVPRSAGGNVRAMPFPLRLGGDSVVFPVYVRLTASRRLWDNRLFGEYLFLRDGDLQSFTKVLKIA